MYLSEYREKCLKDVITLLEPKLVKLTTGLDVHDFDLLCSLNVFNVETMNQAIWQFKRYEDSSLGYTGINRHADEEAVGGWDTVIRREEFEAMFNALQKSMAAPKIPEARPAIVNTPAAPKPVTPKPITPTVKSTPKAAEPIVPYNQQTNKPTYSTPTYYGSGRFGTPIKPTQPAKPKADVSGIGPGSVVVHKSFGDGTVIKIDQAQKYIHVKFAAGTKQFIFPDAFDNGYLSKK